MSSRKCPFCAENIQAAAVKCKHCGSALPPPPPKPLSKRIGEIALAIIGGLFLIGMFRGLSNTGQTEAPVPSPPSSGEEPATAAPDRPIYRTIAPQLWADYDANEVAMDNKIGKAIVQVTGHVSSIQKDFLDKPLITLDIGSDVKTVSLTLADSQAGAAAALTKGDLITARCNSMHRILGDPVGGDCTLVH